MCKIVVKQKLAEQKIYPAGISVAITNVKPVGQGKVLIHCEDKESRQKLQNIAVNELSGNYQVESPKEFKTEI